MSIQFTTLKLHSQIQVLTRLIDEPKKELIESKEEERRKKKQKWFQKGTLRS